MPNGGLITETNRQYYAGAQGFVVPAATTQSVFTFTFDTELVLGNWDPAEVDYGLNNFKLYGSTDGLTYVEIVPGSAFAGYGPYTVAIDGDGNSVITFVGGAIPATNVIVCQLKTLDGGNYGNQDAFGDTVEENYGGYSYLSLEDIVNNFMVAYVGQDKLIPRVNRTDVIFHAKRALQEFSYDTLKSIKSQELTIPNNLSVILPQDYVNYVKLTWVDSNGIERVISPASKTSNPLPIKQDDDGDYSYDINDDGIDDTDSLIHPYESDTWATRKSATPVENQDDYNDETYWYYEGKRYGLEPSYAQTNGSFFIDELRGFIHFSSNISGKTVILKYISDSLGTDAEMLVHKFAEEAMYKWIAYAILSTKFNVPEYIVGRFKKEKFAETRKAKLRLSNIKLEEITQVLRGKSKHIKH